MINYIVFDFALRFRTTMSSTVVAFLSVVENAELISSAVNLPSSINARDNFSTTAATAVRPATVTAVTVSTPAIAPAPITDRPFAAKVAMILTDML